MVQFVGGTAGLYINSYLVFYPILKKKEERNKNAQSCSKMEKILIQT